MRLNWLYDVTPVEVSYVDTPAIDRKFFAIKMVDKNIEDKDIDESFLEKVKNKIMGSFGLVDTKVGRVLSKSNENRLLEAADSINQGVKIIKNILKTLNKNVKEEEMEEKEIKELIENAIKEAVDAFRIEIDAKFEKLLLGEPKVEEPKAQPEIETEEEKAKREAEEKESKGKGSLLTRVTEIVGEKFKEIETKMEVIEKELNIKPEKDKKEVNVKEVEEKGTKNEVDFTGVFQFGEK